MFVLLIALLSCTAAQQLCPGSRSLTVEEAYAQCQSKHGEAAKFDRTSCECSPCTPDATDQRRCISIGATYEQCKCSSSCETDTYTACRRNNGRFDLDTCRCSLSVRTTTTTKAATVRSRTTSPSKTTVRTALTQTPQTPQPTRETQTTRPTTKVSPSTRPATGATIQQCLVSRDLIASCLAVKGTWSSAACSCVNPKCPTTIYDRCRAANLAFDIDTCTCKFTTPVCTTEQKLKCSSNNMLINSRCGCYLPQPMCSDADRERCKGMNMALDEATCRCKLALCGAPDIIQCTNARGLFDFSTCTCSTSACTDEAYAAVKRACLARTPVEGWVFYVDSAKCACLRKPSETRVCDAVRFATVEEECKKLADQNPLYEYSVNKETCTCDKKLVQPCKARPDYFDLVKRCSTADLVFNHEKCSCEKKCPSGRPFSTHETICNALGRGINPRDCSCVDNETPPEPIVCDFASLEEKCSAFTSADSLYPVTVDKEKCACVRTCKNGAGSVSDARRACAAKKLVFANDGSCECVDACKARGVSTDAMAARCKSANLEFVFESCSCQRPVAECNTRCLAPSVLDKASCTCKQPEVDCRLTTKFASLARTCVLADGFVIRGCECEKSCPRASNLLGVAVVDAQKRCLAVNGRFDRDTCACVTPEPCAMQDECARGTRNAANNCQCEQTCPDGRFYGDAKARCLVEAKGGSAENGWDVASCTCKRACSGDIAARVKRSCEARNVPFDGETCSCRADAQCDQSTEAYANAKALCARREGRFNPNDCTCATAPVPTTPLCERRQNAEVGRECVARGGEWQSDSCTCVTRCSARAALTADGDAAAQCADNQKWNGCKCVDTCAPGSRSYDVNKERCAQNNLRFNPNDCGCVTQCDVRDETTRKQVRDCLAAGDRFDYGNCECKRKADEETCSSDEQKAVRDLCATRDSWKFSEQRCRCYANQAVQVTIKTKLDEAIVESIQSRVALMLKNCDVAFRSKSKMVDEGEYQFDVVLQSLGPEAGSCVEKLDSVKNAISQFAEVSDAQLVDAELDEPIIITDMTDSAATTTVVATAVALIAVVANLV